MIRLPLAEASPNRPAPLAQLIQQRGRSLHRGVQATTGLADRPLADLMQLAQRPVDDVHHLAPPDLVWIRPVAGGHTPDRAEAGQPPYAFDLDLARRRGLHVTAVRRDGAELCLELATGQTAVIRPAGADTLADLARWDTWYYTALDAATQHELDALDHDP